MRRRCSSGSKSQTVVPSSTLPEPGDRPGGEQQRLGERGLAGAAVADEGDVADLRRRERLHPRPPVRGPLGGLRPCDGVVIVRTAPRVRPGPACRGPGDVRDRQGCVVLCATVGARGAVAASTMRPADLPEPGPRSTKGARQHARPTPAARRRAGSRPARPGPATRSASRADALTVFGLGLLGRHRGADRRPATSCGPWSASRRQRRQSTSSTARSPGAAVRPARVARSSTPSPTASPTRSARWRRLVPRRRAPVPPVLAVRGRRRSRCSSPTSGPGPRRSGSTRGRAHGARRAVGAARHRARVQHPRAGALDHARAHRVTAVHRFVQV